MRSSGPVADITLRVFVSSPGDVSEERVVAQRVIERINARYAPRVKLSAVLWEHEPLRASSTPQADVPDPADCDFVVCILWSRLGTRLPPDITRADGSRYGSGTEFEFERAIGAWTERGRPHLLVYKKTTEASISLSDAQRARAALSQKESLDKFFSKWFANEDGSIPRAYHNFLAIDEFEDRLEAHLAKLVEQEAAVAGVQPGAGALWEGNPFRGLETFEALHAPVFFGRRRQVAEILDLMRRRDAAGSDAVCIIGPSGSGKSSCARAGVLPMMIEQGVMPRATGWRMGVITPGAKPMAALRAALATAFERADGFESAAPADLVGLVESALKAASPPEGETHLVLLVDQLEELFTQVVRDFDERAAFLDTVAALAASRDIWVVFTMRSDFTDQLQREAGLVKLFSDQGLYHLGFPDLREFSELIRKPALTAGLSFEHDPASDLSLDDIILRDAAAAGDALPLVQFCLYELFNRRRENGELTFEAYQALGGITGAVGERAEACYGAMDAATQAQFDHVFRGLVEISDDAGAKPAKKTADKATLASDPASSRFIEGLLSARLLVAEDADGVGASVRIAHEALLSAWPRLANWIQTNRVVLIARRRVEQAARLWASSDRDQALLLAEGRPLREANDLEQGFARLLSPDTRKFITASRERAKRRAAVRRMAVGALAGAGALLVAGSILWGTREAGQSARLKDSNNQIIASQALAGERLRDLFTSKALERNAAGDIQGAGVLLDAAATTREGQPSFTETFLLADLTDRLSIVSARIREHSHNVTASTNLGSTNNYATGDGQGVVRIWSQPEGELQASWAAHDAPISALAATPDGKFIVSGGLDGLLRVRAPAEPQTDVAVFRHQGPVNDVVAGEKVDGTLTFASTGIDKTFRTWRIGSEDHTFIKTLPFMPSGGISVSQDLQTYAVGARSGGVAVIVPATDRIIELSSPGGAVAEVLVGVAGDWVAARKAGGEVGIWRRDVSGDFRALAPRSEAVRIQRATQPNQLWTISRNGAVHLIDISSDSDRVASLGRNVALADGTLAGEQCVVELNDDGRVVTRSLAGANFASIATSAVRGSRFNLGNVDGHVRLTAPSGETLAFAPICSKQQSLPATSDRTMAVSPSARLAAFGDETGKIQVVEIDSLKIRHTLVHSTSGWVNDLDFSKDGKMLASAGGDLVVWSTDTGAEIQRLKPEPTTQFQLATFDSAGLTSLRSRPKAGPSGETARETLERRMPPTFDKVETRATFNGQDSLELADVPDYDAIALRTAYWIATYRVPSLNNINTQTSDRPTAMAIAGSGGAVATANAAGDVAFMRFNRRSSQAIAAWDGGNSPIRFLAFSPSGNQLAAGDAKGRLHFFDATSGQETQGKTADAGAAGPLVFCCADSGVVVGGLDGKVRVFNAATGEMIAVLADLGSSVLNIFLEETSGGVIVQTASQRSFIALPKGLLQPAKPGTVAAIIAERTPLRGEALGDDVIRLAMEKLPAFRAPAVGAPVTANERAVAAARDGRLAEASDLLKKAAHRTPTESALQGLLKDQLSGRVASLKVSAKEIDSTAVYDGTAAAGSWGGDLVVFNANTGTEIARRAFPHMAMPNGMLKDKPLLSFSRVDPNRGGSFIPAIWNFKTNRIAEYPDASSISTSSDGDRVLFRTILPDNSRLVRINDIGADGALGEEIWRLQTAPGSGVWEGERLQNIIALSSQNNVFEVWSAAAGQTKPMVTSASLPPEFGVTSDNPIDAVAPLDAANRVGATAGSIGLVFDATTGKGKKVSDDVSTVTACTWREGGSAFVLSGGDKAMAVDKDGNLRTEVNLDGGNLMSCGSDWLAIRKNHFIRIHDSADGHLIKRIASVAENISGDIVDQATGMIVYGDSYGMVHTIDPRKPDRTETAWTTDWPILTAKVCSDGLRAIGVGRSEAIQVDLSAKVPISEDKDQPGIFDAECLDGNRVSIATAEGIRILPEPKKAEPEPDENPAKEEDPSGQPAAADAEPVVPPSEDSGSSVYVDPDAAGDAPPEDGAETPEEPKDDWSAAHFVKIGGISVLVAVTADNKIVCRDPQSTTPGTKSSCPDIVLPPEASAARPVMAMQDASGAGKILVATRGGTYLVDVKTGKVTLYAKGRGADAAAAYLPETQAGRVISFEPGDRSILTRSIDNASDLRELSGSTDALVAATALGGASVLGLEASGNISEWDLGTGARLPYERMSKAAVTSAVPLMDGAVVAIGDNDGTVTLYDRSTRTALVRLPIHPDSVRGLTIHPAGTGFLSFSDNELTFSTFYAQPEGLPWLVILLAAGSTVALGLAAGAVWLRRKRPAS